MVQLSDLPVEVLLDNILPNLPIADLLHLAITNKLFAALCSDDTFWKRKCQEDFNFTGSETARTSGWRSLYRGLSHPRVFGWGEKRNGRLGVRELPKDVRGAGIPYPVEVKIPGVRIVSLAAGGMCFHALDSKGNVYVWGAIDGQGGALNSEGFAVKYKEAQVPHKLILPNPVRSISTGRIHSMVLDAKSTVWTFVNWGRPFRLLSPLLDCHAPDTTPLQIECGWTFCTILTKAGDVLVYWPYSGGLNRQIEQIETALNQQGDKNAYPTEDHCIPCVTTVIEADPFRLPPIPTTLPDLVNGLSGEERDAETKLIRIAAYDNTLVGLTNKGHVLKFANLADETIFRRTRWEYLPKFSEPALVRQHPGFAGKDVPDTMRITHITAHFQTFVAYSTDSTSVVLMGSPDTTPTSDPTIIPSLQNQSVISVVLGDYHYAALTSTGKLLTWGAYSNGALGLGSPLDIPAGHPGGYATADALDRARNHRWGIPDPPRVEEPAEVNFSRGKKGGRKFVFGATAAGWHTGALVMDLEPELESEDEDDGTGRMPGEFPPGSPSSHDAGQPPLPPGPEEVPLLPPGGGFGHVFRYGFAARGLMRGGAMGARGRGLGRGGLNAHAPDGHN